MRKVVTDFLIPQYFRMLRKKDYEIELAKGVAELIGRKSHTKDEIEGLCKNLSVRIMKQPYLLARFCHDNELSLEDGLAVQMWVITQFPFLKDIETRGDVPYSEAVSFFEQARVNTIVIHRVNFILHECMVQVYDALERDRRLVFGVKKAMGNAERLWDAYMGVHRRAIERTAWYTMQDHLRLAHDAVSPFKEKVYESIRDYMISLGYRDVEIKARCAVVFLMAKVCGHSFRHFFEQFEDESGVDYSRCFSEDDMQPMVGRFEDLCTTIGIRTAKDAYGYYCIKDFDPEKSLRCRSAWDAFIRALRDDDLIDEAAKDAIALNPEMQEEYQHILEEEERKAMASEIDRLGGKFKVTKS